jgi:hypothetical protein
MSRIARAKSMVRYLAYYAGIMLRPQRATFRRQRHRGQPRYRLTACIRIKNEARFLPELLAHHHLLGFDHFFLYDNNSTDQPETILAPFVAKGLATIVPWKTVPAAPSCYQHFFENLETQAQWVAFVDADEFIVERVDGALNAALTRLASKTALGINSRYFGSNGHLSIPVGLVMEQFPRSSPLLGDLVKVIIKPEKALSYFNSHNFIYKNLSFATDIRGRTIFGTLAAAEVESELELNHYVYRSREDYLAKLGLGFVDKDGYKNRARRIERVDSEFSEHNSADGSWAGIKYGPRVRSFLQELGYPERFWRSTKLASANVAAPRNGDAKS